MRTRRIVGALASLVVPGFGHVAVGRPWRGVAWYLTALVAFLLLPLVVWMPLIMTVVLVRVVAAVEIAVLRDVRVTPWGRVLLTWLAMGLAFFAIGRGIRAFYLEGFRIPSGGMLPTLLIGDHLFVNKVADWGRGDVIVFVNPCEPDKDFIKRAIAVGGDTVEIRCSELYVNGARVERELVEGPCRFLDVEFGDDVVAFDCARYRETLGGHSYEVIFPPEWPALEMRRRRGEHPTGFNSMRQRDFPAQELPTCPFRSSDDGVGRIENSPEGKPSGLCPVDQHYVVPEDHVFVLGDNRYNSSDSRVWGPVPVENVHGRAFHIWWSEQPGEDGEIRWDRVGSSIR